MSRILPTSTSTSGLGEPDWVVWLLASDAGQVEACAPGIEQVWGIHPQGLPLERLFGEPLARRLLSAPEDRFEWTRPPQDEERQPTLWLLSRHRLVEGGVLVRAGTRQRIASSGPPPDVASTERRHMAQLLHETNQRLELAVSAGRLGLWDWDVVQGTVYFSPAWKAQLGYEDHELENRFDTWRTLLHPDDSEAALLLALKYVSEPERGAHYANEFRMQAKDGSWRWVAACGLVVRGEKGQGVRVTGYHVDITELKARQAQQHLLQENLRSTNENLERLSRMKDEFLANMSHELRTPLNAVLGQAEALSEGIFGPVTEQQRAALGTIEESGQHLLSVINDVLDVAKSSVGQLELDMGLVPVEEVCQESLRLVSEQARRKGISLAYSREEQAVQVWADRRRLRQVLLNLLSNAQKFTPEGGSVGLSVAVRAGGEVAFSVWDTGPGIREQDRPRLFEPFVQLDAGLGRHHEGTGLGLALVRRMVEQHAGRVELESQLGQGSRFTVVLPLIPGPRG